MHRTVIFSILLITAANTKEFGGVVRYSTEESSRSTIEAPSYGQLCNNSLCLQAGIQTVHQPVLSLDDYERRQGMASLQNMNSADQQYNPHPYSSPLMNDFQVIDGTSHNETCIRCPTQQLTRIARNQRLARVPQPKLRFCSKPNNFLTDFPLMVLRGPLMGSFVGEGEYSIVFQTVMPLPAKTCRYNLKVFSLRCPPLPTIRHRSFLCTNENLWGSRCLVRCEGSAALEESKPFRCVKRKRDAVWKIPSDYPDCKKKNVQVTTTTTAKPVVESKKGRTQVSEKRRIACRWPKAPKDGWSTCGRRGRWKKKLFVREDIPCFRGCNDGFIASTSLGEENKNRITCVSGSWEGFENFECIHQDEKLFQQCATVAQKKNGVQCSRINATMVCQLFCSDDEFMIAKSEQSKATLDCRTANFKTHIWPECHRAGPPIKVEGCQNMIVENAEFPLKVSTPVFRSSVTRLGSNVTVSCNLTAIDGYGEFGIFCTALDEEFETEAMCNFSLISAASSCKSFRPGPHVIANCGMPSGVLAQISDQPTLPVGTQCEFICEFGFVLPTSRLDETYTVCENDGEWTVEDFDLCKPQVAPRVIRGCQNQQFSNLKNVSLILPTFRDIMDNALTGECTPTAITSLGKTIVNCEMDDYEVRTRETCQFIVFVEDSS